MVYPGGSWLGYAHQLRRNQDQQQMHTSCATIRTNKHHTQVLSQQRTMTTNTHSRWRLPMLLVLKSLLCICTMCVQGLPSLPTGDITRNHCSASAQCVSKGFPRCQQGISHEFSWRGYHRNSPGWGHHLVLEQAAMADHPGAFKLHMKTHYILHHIAAHHFWCLVYFVFFANPHPPLQLQTPQSLVRQKS